MIKFKKFRLSIGFSALASVLSAGVLSDSPSCLAQSPANAPVRQQFSAQPNPQPHSGPFATPLTDALIDSAVSADWVEGTEHPLAKPVALNQVLWTQSTGPGGVPLQYGVSTRPGPRHLRLGFKTPLSVGSILVSGGGEVSVLAPNAPYPGNLADDSQWIEAKRLVDRQPSTAEVGADNYALWVLPSAIKTRAIRFTHVAAPTDSSFFGTLGGAYLLSERFSNAAPQAMVLTSSNTLSAHLLIDEQYNKWLTWDNGPDFSHPVSKANPEWIVLSWPHPIPVAGLAALWAGFNAADVQTFAGQDNANLRSAPETDWRPLGQNSTLRSQYPRPLGVDWFDFGKTVTTRAVRLRLTQVTDESHHPHLVGKTHNGNRVWLGELMALEPLGVSALHSSVLAEPRSSMPNPPIPVRFTLDAPGFVTLVIDDAKGNRVRNLVANTWFEKGANTAWWDGTDDLGRNADAENHGVYLIPTNFVSPGTYHVHGLVHAPIDVHFEFSIYSPGHPAWETVDGKGGWLTNHTPPQSTLFVPADKAPGGKPLVYLGSYISEGGAGLAWVDLNGVRQGGRGWVGGNWTAAPFLARDTGAQADPGVFAYVGAPWGDFVAQPGKPLSGLIRLTGLTQRGDKSVINYSFNPGPSVEHDAVGRVEWNHQMGGLAVHNGLAVVSLSLQNQLLFIDARSGKSLGTTPLASPQGVAFDAQGGLLVLSGKHLLRYGLPGIGQLDPQHLAPPETLVSQGLDSPVGITTDPTGNIYISDAGSSNQVHVYSSAGKLLRSIGHPGVSHAGPYDPMHMNSPAGISIDGDNHLWVAENDFQPKRVSVWSLDGQLVKAFYGPSEYGGGGSLDPQDKTKFYYHGMEFKLDWATGANTVSDILYRPGKDDLALPLTGTPTTVLYESGHRYFINSYLSHGTNGPTVGVLFLDKGGIIHPVAALGNANDWPLLRSDAFKALLPAASDLTSTDPAKATLFSWSDLNENGKVDPDELHFVKSTTGAVTIISGSLKGASQGSKTAPGPLMLNAFVGGKAMLYAPERLTPSGVPVYDLAKGQILAEGAQRNTSDGGGTVLHDADETVLTTAPLPFAREGIGGVNNQGHRWSYPSLWPGLHPSHNAPVPDRPGELIGTTHLLGPLITAGSGAEPVWAINGNMGDIYLFTADGLFVSQLFEDVRQGKPWNMPVAPRNLLLNDLSMHDENFFPSMTQTSDGNTYIVDGGRTSIVRVDGLNSIHKLTASDLPISSQDIEKAQGFLKQQEISRQSSLGEQSIRVEIHSGVSLTLKDLFNTLKTADWAPVDRRITQQGWAQTQDSVEAAVTVAGGRLYAAYRTNDPKLLANSGAVANAPFKTGGALDLMIGTNPAANPERASAVAGDLRLLVYQVKGVTKAMLYRPVVAGTTDPVPFSSPSRTIKIDKVQDVSSSVELEADNGNYSFSIPLATLGLNPVPGQRIKADVGILRGNGVETTQRVYWSNKATGITSDVPSEAELTPNLWGEWVFQTAP